MEYFISLIAGTLYGFVLELIPVAGTATDLMKQLEAISTKKALKNLVLWTSLAAGQEAFYKDEIAKKAK